MTSSRPWRTRSSRGSGRSTPSWTAEGRAPPRAPAHDGPGTLHAIAPADGQPSTAPAVLRPGLLDGVGITVAGGAPEIEARLSELGATAGHDVLVYRAPEPHDAAGVRDVLDGAWGAIREHMLPPARSDGVIVLIAPPPGDAHHTAARAGLENLARTLSIEWARFRIRPVAVLPGTAAGVAELVAFLGSRAGAYYAGCTFTLR